MPRKSFFVSVSLLALMALASILWAAQVTPKVTPRAEPFSLSNVRLLDSPFKAAMDRDGAYLLALDADRLLSGFLENAGLKPKGKKYGGWEEQSLAGHSLGHHLSAVSLMYLRLSVHARPLRPARPDAGHGRLRPVHHP
jgi:hypothetical protein